MITASIARHELKRRQARRVLARRHFLYEAHDGETLGFLGSFPPPTDRGFLVGYHIRRIATVLEHATQEVEAGHCYYAIVTCPPRHGKSSLVCKTFPAWHLGRNYEHEVIISSYGASLVAEHSRDLRRTVMEPEFGRTFRDTKGLPVRLSQESRSVDTWSLEGHHGKVHAIGLDGSVTGKGANVLVIDDPHKGWLEAQSQTKREHVWQVFTNDLMQRLAPAHAVVIIMTRWHKDDLWGRIEKAMADDPMFPRFEFFKFPWRHEDYPDDFLFPERYTEAWYRRMRASLKNPAAAPALFDCEPIAVGGNRFAVDKVQIVPEAPEGLRWLRYWDLASSDAERMGSDPSYTVGALVAVRENGDGAPVVWVRDVSRFRAEAPERDGRIRALARADGPRVNVQLETVAGYKDTATRLERDMAGHVVVLSDAKSVDKQVRAQDLEPVVAAGNLRLVRGDWNTALIEELAEFPAGHDDQVDALSGAFAQLWDPDDWLVV